LRICRIYLPPFLSTKLCTEPHFLAADTGAQTESWLPTNLTVCLLPFGPFYK
jgi:hypothetical protein